MLIYKVTNNINGQIYIGQTTLSLEQRKYKKDLIIKAKLNNLKFLNTLAQFIGVKDIRSLGKVLEVKYKKDILFKLKNIIKCTPNNEETH